MHTPTLNHYFEPKIMRIIIEIIRYTVTDGFCVCVCGLCRLLDECRKSSAAYRRRVCTSFIRIMPHKLLTFCLVLCASNICLPVHSFKMRHRRASDSSASRVFVVRQSDVGDLFTVGTVPPGATDRFQFVGTGPQGLLLDGATGMVSKSSSAQWDSPSTFEFQVTHRTAATPGAELLPN